jgi:hypothetical protein
MLRGTFSEIALGKAEGEGPIETTKSGLILVVEEISQRRDELEIQLRRLGFRTMVAASWRFGLGLLNRHAFDGVVVLSNKNFQIPPALKPLGFDIPLVCLDEEGLSATRNLLDPETLQALKIIMGYRFKLHGYESRRKYPRFDIKLGTWWGCLNEKAAAASLAANSTAYARILNLSAKGAYVSGASPLPTVGEVLSIQFIDPIRGGLTRAPAIVRWVRDGERAGFGVEFLALDQGASIVIDKLCEVASAKSVGP